MTGPMNVVIASVRAWTEPAPPARRPRATATNKRKADRSGRGPLRDLLVLDCETTTDPTQALTFGVWRHCTADRDGQLTMMSEGLFHADDLPTTDPAGYNALVEHCRTELADVDRRHHRADPRLSLTGRTAFIEGTFYKLAWKARAHVVMFNKPFDLSRLALSAGASRGGFYGGFNLKLFGNDIYRPRVRVKHLDSKKAFASFSTTKERDEAWQPGQTNHGYFLDLRTWAFALTGNPLDLVVRPTAGSPAPPAGASATGLGWPARAHGRLRPGGASPRRRRPPTPAGFPVRRAGPGGPGRAGAAAPGRGCSAAPPARRGPRSRPARLR
jgi:hypothetical protein